MWMRRLPILFVLVLIALIGQAQARGGLSSRSKGCPSATPTPVYFTNFGASNDSPADSYIAQYITYLQGKGSDGYQYTGGGLLGNFMPQASPDSPCGNAAPFGATNVEAMIAHVPKVTLFSLRITCDTIKNAGCTLGEIESDVNTIYGLAAAAGIKTFVQTPSPCELAPPTSLTTSIQTLHTWVIANYPNNYVEMTTPFSLSDGTSNPILFSGDGVHYNSTAQTLAFQQLKAAIGF